MDILQFIKDEGYTSAKFHSLSGEDVHIQLSDVASSDDLFKLLEVTPTSINYFPFERAPYLDCIQDHSYLKLKLIKP
ncbi:hypothetical protein [Halobacillus litoralis]|uniref:hypothetical protein n=1 Tax=Halobacillus litoralis TaxID=45668 RepID=UPI001CFEA848|nr:hypothetical protein [Halobacillus litoralis]